MPPIVALPRAILLALPLLAAASPAPQGEIRGKVVESINAATYTYVHVDTGSAKVWAAEPLNVARALK